MPLPTPNKDEEKRDFINRCLSDTIAKAEFPDAMQRLAVCNTQWQKSMSEKSIKSFELKEFTIIDEEEEKGVFSGYASVFDVVDLDSDIIEKGAFSESLRKMPVVPLLSQHQPGQQVGAAKGMIEDDKGLRIDKGMIYINTTAGRDEYEKMMANRKAGLPSKMSIGYRVKDYEIKEGIRVIKSLDLFEVSLVTFPANPLAEVANVKSEKPATEREFETFLRDSGFSRKEATAIASVGYKVAMKGDAMDLSKEREAKEDSEAKELLKELNNLTNLIKVKHNDRGNQK